MSPGRATLSTHLNLAVCVRERAVLFLEKALAGRITCVIRGFSCGTDPVRPGDSCCEGLSRMTDVGIRHRRIFAHDVHRPNIAGVWIAHDFDHGESAIWIEIRFPEFWNRECMSGLSTETEPSGRTSVSAQRPMLPGRCFGPEGGEVRCRAADMSRHQSG